MYKFLKNKFLGLNQLVLIILLISLCTNSNSQVLQNYGSIISAKSGCVITVNGSVLNQTGTIDVNQNAGAPATMYVSQDVTNNSTILADGHIHLSGNWFDNGSFSSTLGTVFMDGATQFLGGTSATIFHNLTLNGSGFKIQQVNKFATGVLSLNHLELKTETYMFYVENTALGAITRTSGFVSSLNGGFLARRTNSAGLYLYPVGSSLGTTRYRPVELTPTNSIPNQYTVRFANLDATQEGYDRSMHDDSICQANPLFYHQINRTVGATNADLTINYDPSTDGSWSALSRWNLSSPIWEKITGSFTASGTPFFKAQQLNWGTFTDIPYILSNPVIEPIFDPILPICYGSQLAPLSTISNNGISGSWLPAIDNTQTTTYTFTPNAGQCGGTATLTVTVLPQLAQPQIQLVQPTCSIATGSVSVQNVNTAVGVLYELLPANTLISPQSNTSGTFSSLPPGDYDLTCTLNGCLSTSSFTVSPAPIVPTVNISPSVPALLTCANTQTSVSATGGDIYSWDGGLTPNNSLNSFTNPGVYTVTITATNGCTATSSITISQNISPPSATITNISGTTLLTCSQTAISLSATNGVSYTWNNGISNIGVSSNLTVTQPGTYTVTVRGNNGCTSTASIVINSNTTAPLIENVSIIQPLCNQNTGIVEVFTNLSSGSATYTITGLNPVVAAQSNTTGSFANLSPGNYEITVTENGCVSAPSIVTVNTPPAVPTISVNNPTICAGEQVNLSATANPSGGTFSWSTGQTSQLISVNPLTTTTYQVTYELNGCSVQTNSNVTVNPKPIVMMLDQNICLGDTANIVALPSVPGGTFEWLPNGETTQSISVVPATTTTYTVTYTLNQCSALPVNVTVNVSPVPVAGFITNPQIFDDYGQSVDFLNTSLYADSYDWDFGDGFTSDLFQPTHYFQNITEDGMLVTLTAYNSAGCQDTFSYVIERADELIYYVPNSFTPDANGRNDVFQPVFTEGFDPYSFRMLIFNRWGQIVFESQDATIGWEGTYGTGTDIFKCQDGVYTWQIEFRRLENDEIIYLDGHVTLIK
jgi:gliding motility-associated-like protein